MLKTLLICTAISAPLMITPAQAQMQHTEGMQHGDGMGNGGLAGMGGMHGMSGMSLEGMEGMDGMDMSSLDMNGMDGMADILQGVSKLMRQMQERHGMHMGDSGMGHMASANSGPQGVGGSPLSEPGQSAFAAIAEVVNVLKADPATDWETVDIDALRNHLRDMDIVTIDSTTVSTEIDGGMRFDVTGAGEVTGAIRRMVSAHAGMMNGTDGWVYSIEEIPGGAAMMVTVPAADLAKLKALGFYGIMASGMHHQPHHYMMATGGHPHG